MSEGVIEVGAIYDEIEEIAQRAAEGGLTVVWGVAERNPLSGEDQAQIGQEGSFYASLGVAVAMVDWLKRTASGRDSE